MNHTTEKSQDVVDSVDKKVLRKTCSNKHPLQEMVKQDQTMTLVCSNIKCQDEIELDDKYLFCPQCKECFCKDCFI